MFLCVGLVMICCIVWILRKKCSSTNLKSQHSRPNDSGWMYTNPRGSEFAHFLKVTRLHITIYANFICNVITTIAKHLLKIVASLFNICAQIFQWIGYVLNYIMHCIGRIISPFTPPLQFIVTKVSYNILFPTGKVMTRYVTKICALFYHVLCTMFGVMGSFIHFTRNCFTNGVSGIYQQFIRMIQYLFNSFFNSYLVNKFVDCCAYLIFNSFYYIVWIFYHILKSHVILPWIIGIFLYVLKILLPVWILTKCIQLVISTVIPFMYQWLCSYLVYIFAALFVYIALLVIYDMARLCIINKHKILSYFPTLFYYDTEILDDNGDETNYSTDLNWQSVPQFVTIGHWRQFIKCPKCFKNTCFAVLLSIGDGMRSCITNRGVIFSYVLSYLNFESFSDMIKRLQQRMDTKFNSLLSECNKQGQWGISFLGDRNDDKASILWRKFVSRCRRSTRRSDFPLVQYECAISRSTKSDDESCHSARGHIDMANECSFGSDVYVDLEQHVPQIRKKNKSVKFGLISRGVTLTSGGSYNVCSFREKIKNGYLPNVNDITFDGIFHEYYFDINGADINGDKKLNVKEDNCDSNAAVTSDLDIKDSEPELTDNGYLFSPIYSKAVTTSPVLGDVKNDSKNELDYYLTVSMKSMMNSAKFQRKKLNLVVVLDISNSMDSPFDQYFSNNINQQAKSLAATNGGEESSTWEWPWNIAAQWKEKSKLNIAKQAIIGLIGTYSFFYVVISIVTINGYVYKANFD